MLVINRRRGEAVMIGDGIEVRVLELTPVRVKLGLTAPPGVTILREEILLARASNVAAALSTGASRLAELAAALRSSTPPVKRPGDRGDFL